MGLNMSLRMRTRRRKLFQPTRILPRNLGSSSAPMVMLSVFLSVSVFLPTYALRLFIQLEKKRSRDDHHHGTGASTGGADVSRRLSRRQEKAPEGQPPHASGQRDLPHGAAAEPGPAPADTDSESEDIPNHKASTAVPIIPPPVTVGPEVIAPLPVTTSSGAAESSGAGAGAVAHANEDDDDDEHHAEGDHPREKRSSKLISKFKEMITK